MRKHNLRKLTASSLMALALFFVASTGPAAEAKDDPRNRARLGNWQDRMERIDGLLQEGKYKKARSWVNGLLDDMVDEIMAGDAGPLLSMATLMRSIAEAGLGNEREALWDLQVAKAMDQKISATDLSAYGEAGAFLMRTRETARDHVSQCEPADLEKPKKIKDYAPSYPMGKRYSCLEDVIIVQSVVDEQGLPQEPRVLIGDSILGFAAMQSLRDWRFEPATCDGEPASFVYNVTVNFRLPRCSS